MLNLGSKIAATWYDACTAVGAAAIVLVVVSLVTQPLPEERLRGLVWGLKPAEQEDDSVVGDAAWYRSPVMLGGVALVIAIALDVVFA